MVGMKLTELTTPAFLVDRARVEKNCATILDKARRSGVRLRPHVKTHKTVEAARLQHGGAHGPITVSTMAEAEFFAASGFDDITWAVPFDPAKLGRVDALAARARLQLLLDHPGALKALEERARSSSIRYRVYLKIDSGARRSGLEPDDPRLIDLARLIARSDAVDFRGVLTHAGHSYLARSRDEILRIAEEEAAVLTRTRALLAQPDLERSLGSTPTAAVVERFPDCEEARPGNYVFFDAFQATLGSCTLDDVAVSVLVSVIGIYPGQNRIVVDGGALAFSKDTGPTHLEPRFGYGIVCDAELRPLPMRLVSMSQEHGQITVHDRETLERLSIGTRLRVIPNHSCLTAAMFDHYRILDGDRVIDEWRPVRGW